MHLARVGQFVSCFSHPVFVPFLLSSLSSFPWEPAGRVCMPNDSIPSQGKPVATQPSILATILLPTA